LDRCIPVGKIAEKAVWRSEILTIWHSISFHKPSSHLVGVTNPFVTGRGRELGTS